MTGVVRFETHVDLDSGEEPPGFSLSARLDAVLADGRRAVALDGRGWSGWVSTGEDPWPHLTRAELESEARMVVGPDEPPDHESYEEYETSHWASIARELAEQGVEADPAALRRLPNDVVFSERVLSRLRA